ncbi:MAG TPA: hypothetical protein VFA06_16390, partial [Actinocrinis sp.]|uniref:hypothetical protein n=1 Tax=Actinocrinis sp. TaxID=1920516 RepID=UPI002D3EC5DF
GSNSPKKNHSKSWPSVPTGVGTTAIQNINGITDKNVDTLLSSQETDTPESLTSKTDRVIASVLLCFFSLPFPAPPLYQTFSALFAQRFSPLIRLACRSGRAPGDSEKSRQPKVNESNPCVNWLIYRAH